jgi:ribosome assembly protein 3
MKRYEHYRWGFEWLLIIEKSASPIPEITPGSTKKSKKPKPSIDEVEPKTEPLQPSSSSPSPAPPSIKKSKKKSKPAADEDVPMTDAPEPTTKKSKSPQEDFSAIYLRKIAAELADDLDKVREAQDFKANSVPMLIHALKQGESMFSAEEKRRVVGAAGQ